LKASKELVTPLQNTNKMMCYLIVCYIFLYLFISVSEIWAPFGHQSVKKPIEKANGKLL